MEFSGSCRKCKTIDELFNIWKNKASETVTYKSGKIEKAAVIDHSKNKFIPDGIVNNEIWQDSEHKKILYVLKEAYVSKDDEAYDLAKWLRDDHPDRRIWNRVARWTYGIQNTTANEVARYIPYIDKDKRLRDQLFEQIAVINLKKSNGESTSVIEEVAAYAQADREEIIRELQLIDPDIVICGSTFWILYQIVFGNEPLKGSQACDNWYYYKNLDGKERLYIDYYHPANQWPDLVNYYAVMNIYQQALIEKAGK